MNDTQDPPVNWAMFQQTRNQLGPNFMRVLGYFREDGDAAIARIETAMRAGNPAPMVLPAHTLKTEARQFGGEALGALAEEIEMFARDCVEARESPADYVHRVVKLRPMFEALLAEIDAETNPLQRRKPVFGRRAG